MTSLSREILDNWQIRKSKKQKTAFIEFLQSRIPEARVEKKGSNRNIVIGDVDSAKVVYTAHYDTCAVMPIPNFITPKNILFYIIYQLLLVGGMFALCAAFGFIVEKVTGSLDIAYFSALVFLWLLIILMIAGPANKHTANDNTSGIITLCEIYAAMTPEQRAKCAIVFFDNEEAGLLGSGAFHRMHKKTMKEKLLINFDCVSDGDNILFVLNKKARKAAGEALEAAFLPRGEKTMMFEKSSRAFYPSDQQHFPFGVGVAALKKSPVLGYYMDRIHTPRDTVFDERNIELLRDGAIHLVDKL